MPTGEYLQYGGQAIIEGVMMRSPHHYSVAVRAPNKEIIIHCEPLEKTWIGRQKWLKLPFLRGTLGILDAMALGYRALRFAGNIQIDPKYAAPEEGKSDESAEASATPEPSTEAETTDDVVDDSGEPGSAKKDSLTSIAVGGAMIGGLAIGLFLFNYLPNFLAIQLKSANINHPIAINFATEVIKVIFFLGYLYLISLMGEIKRLFQYHGAEHKAINVLEADQDLTIENCQAQTRLHPRCGTSFAIIVLIVGMILFTFMPKPEIEGSRILTSIARFLVEIPLLPIIAGISYEAIRLAGRMKNKKLMTWLFWPGLMTQYITTKEPDESQIEVSMAALQAVIDADEAKLAAEAA
ncbi:MAG: DUF1385 domain-containing protein [Fimbriimonadaceae bacterium]|nr:DUF1385 domain-containing protein [Fimbriimonadaceae bacterium]